MHIDDAIKQENLVYEILDISVVVFQCIKRSSCKLKYGVSFRFDTRKQASHSMRISMRRCSIRIQSPVPAFYIFFYLPRYIKLRFMSVPKVNCACLEVS